MPTKQWVMAKGLYTFSGCTHGPGAALHINVTCTHVRPPDHLNKPGARTLATQLHTACHRGDMATWPITTTTTTWMTSVMTQSAWASDPSLSHTQPRSDSLVFQPRHIVHHTVSHDLVLLHMPACLHVLTHIHVAPEGLCMFPAYIPCS